MSTTKYSLNHNNRITLLPALAMYFAFFLTGVLLLSLEPLMNEVYAKRCTDGSINDDRSSSCNSQDSHSLTNSPSRNNDKTPFVLPFP